MKVYTLNGVPYTFDPVRAVLVKAARRRQVSPGQLGLFGGPNEGDTKVENGVTYRLNANSRWERADEPDKPRAIVPVIEENTMETVQDKKTFGIPREGGFSPNEFTADFFFGKDSIKNPEEGFDKVRRESAFPLQLRDPVYIELDAKNANGEMLEEGALFQLEYDSKSNQFWAVVPKFPGTTKKKYPILRHKIDGFNHVCVAISKNLGDNSASWAPFEGSLGYEDRMDEPVALPSRIEETSDAKEKAFKYPKTYGISARKEKTIPEDRIFYFFDNVLEELRDQERVYKYRKGKRYKIEDTQPVYIRMDLRTKQGRSLEQGALFEIQRDEDGNYWAIGSNSRKYPILEMRRSVDIILSAVAPDPEYSKVDAPYTHRELLADYYYGIGRGPSMVAWNPVGTARPWNYKAN